MLSFKKIISTGKAKTAKEKFKIDDTFTLAETTKKLRDNKVGLVTISSLTGPNEAHQAFFEALKTNTTVQTLDLGGCVLGDEGATIVAEVLEFNKILTNVSLCNTQIGTAGGEALAKMLELNNSLTTVNLSQNPLGKAVYALIKALEKNSSITCLRLLQCGIDNESIRAVAEMLKVNTKLTALHLEEKKEMSSVLSVLMKIAEIRDSTLRKQELENFLVKNAVFLSEKKIDKVEDSFLSDHLELDNMYENKNWIAGTITSPQSKQAPEKKKCDKTFENYENNSANFFSSNSTTSTPWQESQPSKTRTRCLTFSSPRFHTGETKMFQGKLPAQAGNNSNSNATLMTNLTASSSQELGLKLQ